MGPFFDTRICAIFIYAMCIAHRVSANPVCTTLECRLLGATYLNNMDQNISACSDFFEHVCSRWGVYNPVPQWEVMWSVEQEMQQKVNMELKELLENFPSSDIQQIQQAKAVYRACMNLPFLPKSDPAEIRDITMRIGNWPMLLPKNKDIPSDTPWWLIDNMYSEITGESALFDIPVGADPKNLNQIYLKFVRLTSPYGTLIRNKQWDVVSRQKDHYKSFLYKVIEKVSPLTPIPVRKALEKDLDDVINFRESLREICYALRRNSVDMDSIEMFQIWYNKQTQSKNSAKIAWLQKARAVNKNGTDPQGKPITTKTKIMIQPSYAVQLAKLLGQTPKRTIVNHIHLYFAERYVKLSPDMVKELKQSVSIDHNKSRLRKPFIRWEWCVHTHNLRTALNVLYIGTKFQPNNKAEVESLFNQAKNILQKQVSYSTWMSNEMKAKTMHMVTKIRSAIGYPEIYDICPGNEQPQTMELIPTSMQFCHIPGPSEIYASAANLQTPIYTQNVPYAINYGATVSLLGHELYHAFDDTGIQHSYGQNKPLWPSDTYQLYSKRKKCFQDQYEKFRAIELKKYNLRPETKLKSTYNEDLADVMGLKLAYQGFKEEMARSNGACHVLPGLEKIGCEKLFFIAFANTLCTSARPGIMEQLSMDSIYSTNRVRVNGAVANMKEFSDAFGCRPSDPLNIKERCDLWR